MVTYASEKRLFAEVYFDQRGERNEGWKAAKAGCGHCAEHCAQGGDEGWKAC